MPFARGNRLALVLVAAVCAEAQAEGARFVGGASCDGSSPSGRLYERIAVGHDSAECHCAGRAFRHLADLHGSRVRDIVRLLPPRERNFSA